MSEIIAHHPTKGKWLYVWRMGVVPQCMNSACTSLRTKLDMTTIEAKWWIHFIVPSTTQKNLIIEDSLPSRDSSESNDDEEVPLLPPLPPPEQCDWCISSTGCFAPELPLQNCQKENCHVFIFYVVPRHTYLLFNPWITCAQPPLSSQNWMEIS